MAFKRMRRTYRKVRATTKKVQNMSRAERAAYEKGKQASRGTKRRRTSARKRSQGIFDFF